MAQPIMRPASDGQRSLPRRLNFTVPILERLTCPAGKAQAYVYDSKTPHLAMLATANGAKTFYLYKKIGGRPQRVRLGGFPEISIDQARKMAAQVNGQIANGIDPQAGRRSIAKDATLQQVWERWLKDHAEPRLRASTLRTDTSRFDTCFGDWKNRRVRSITTADVERLHIAVGKSAGHTSANRAVQLLKRLMNFAKVQPNPAEDIDLFREEKLERYLSGDELRRLLSAIDAEPNTDIADFVRLCLWTGQRRGNVQGMEWSEVNLDAGTWTIPTSKFKGHRPHSVPLVGPAVEVLKRRSEAKEPDAVYVFPSSGEAGHLAEPKEGWKRILKRAGITAMRLHDLRHNFASAAATAGVSLHAIGAVLGHTDSRTTERYSHLAMSALRATVATATGAMEAAVQAANAEAEKAAKTPAGASAKGNVQNHDPAPGNPA